MLFLDNSMRTSVFILRDDEFQQLENKLIQLQD